ncbi:PAS domain S-box-containing protein [Rhizobium sp. PP-F2F-G48]|uniref:PAS domain S-box protein n=1 Tax=Rhizobium sp. PP-F2F-G48 TaxID=2135651 RepID=UPI001046545F|nr:PAS domain S-box protein [Rhizobium sp. PP-F2F-G48]TCM58975.1 PAS domain S-box-containing protein [Rhizobium sp. PP-F2F-G48]
MPIPDRTILEALYNDLADAVVVTDRAGVILSANPAASILFGFELAFPVGQPFSVLLHRVSEAQGISAGSGSVHYTRADGSRFAGRTRAIAVGGEAEAEGRLIRIISTADRPELPDQELPDMASSSRAVDTALDVIAEGIAIYDKDERLLLCNRAYRALLGPVGERLRIGMPVAEIALDIASGEGMAPAPSGSPEAKAWVRRQIDLFRRADGKAEIFSYNNGRWLRAENTLTADGNTVAIRVDVTDLKRIEMALERQRQDYATLVETIPDLITRLAPDLTYTFVNQRFAALIGLSQDEVVGRRCRDFIAKDDPLAEILFGLTPEAPATTREQRRRTAGGDDVWILWSNLAVFEGKELSEYVTVGRDITEMKQQQMRIAEQSFELQRKNEALGQFTSSVSHDLKAPMRQISMFADMIADDIAANDLGNVADYASKLREKSRRLIQLVDSLLDYARIADRIFSPQRVALRDVVEDALGNLQSHIEESGARVTVEDLPDVIGDAELLKRLFQNIIGNAIKYRRAGVTPELTVNGWREGGLVHIAFPDNGVGIDPRHADRIFDIFQRLHRNEDIYPGTGVGLSLARRIAESHGGTIVLDPDYRTGARFIVSLPSA